MNVVRLGRLMAKHARDTQRNAMPPQHWRPIGANFLDARLRHCINVIDLIRATFVGECVGVCIIPSQFDGRSGTATESIEQGVGYQGAIPFVPAGGRVESA